MRQTRTLIERFEQQVASSPGSTALMCEGRELSYAELDVRANALAFKLIG